MRKIIYIHGFASSSASSTAVKIKEHFGPTALTPDLKSKPEEDIKYLESLIENLTDPILIGSSLGGFYAEYLSCKHKLEGILINPLVNIDLITPYIGFHNYYYNNRVFEFTRDDYLYLKKMEREISMLGYSSRKKVVLLGKKDEQIPYYGTVDYFKKKSIDVLCFENETHRFNNSEIVINNAHTLLSNK